MKTANSVMQNIWLNASGARDNEVTINRDYLYERLLELEHYQYNSGHDDGYRDRGLAESDSLPIDNDFDCNKVEWASYDGRLFGSELQRGEVEE